MCRRGRGKKKDPFFRSSAKNFISLPVRRQGTGRHGQSGNDIFMRLCTRLPWLGFSK
ncbi:hypothetical protein HMPREF9441_03789 [Paraprevotella clara YIT 11840]|uniref:Uncharacterized protein n=1 Tax=Paraprevotella clara YIT 11840 TaxID=762968 RepID=G5SWL6_9BACT|nr:hypothetical protein HMPREF9441_03789 [Paraprevotella clara YIT 11840]